MTMNEQTTQTRADASFAVDGPYHDMLTTRANSWAVVFPWKADLPHMSVDARLYVSATCCENGDAHGMARRIAALLQAARGVSTEELERLAHPSVGGLSAIIATGDQMQQALIAWEIERVACGDGTDDGGCTLVQNPAGEVRYLGDAFRQEFEAGDVAIRAWTNLFPPTPEEIAATGLPPELFGGRLEPVACDLDDDTDECGGCGGAGEPDCLTCGGSGRARGGDAAETAMENACEREWNERESEREGEGGDRG